LVLYDKPKQHTTNLLNIFWSYTIFGGQKDIFVF